MELSMKKNTLLLLAILTALPLVSCENRASIPPQSISNSTQNHSATLSDESAASRKQEDLAFFCKSLEKGHKNMYAHISEEEFQREKNIIETQLASMTDSDFYYSLKHLASLIGDSHTSLDFYESKYAYLHGLPFAIQRYDDGWHLMMVEEKNKQYLGYLLLSINGTSMESIAQKAETIISSDNQIWKESQLSNTINFKEALEYIGVAEKDAPVRLSLQDPDSPSDTCTLEINAMEEAEINNSTIISLRPEQPAATAASGIYRAFPLDTGCYFIQYNQCEEAPDLSMAEFTDIIINDLENNQYHKIILDLRYNSGGDSRIIKPLIKGLKKLRSQQEFTVYTLIGRKTFSSAIINAIQTKNELDSVLIGTPTGGSVNSYGELNSFKLKHLPIIVYYSTKYFELIPGYDGDSLYPDITVTEDFQAYMSGVDTSVDTVLALP